MTTETAPAEQSSPPATIRVLVVTDDPHIRDDVQFGFPTGVEVLVAADAREAWRILQTVTPSVVVVDIQTGSAGGFGLCKDMSASERLAELPVLMLLERPQDSWLATQAGARLSRIKPIDSSRLVTDTLSLTA